MEQNKKIEDFLEAVGESASGFNHTTNWPLNGAQMDAYFDIDEAIDVYNRVMELKKKITIKEIAELFPAPDVIRLFLQHNALVGLKVARKLGFSKITQEELVEYTALLFSILEEKVKGDPFCLDGKNLLLSSEEINFILKETDWKIPKHNENKKIGSLIVTANNLCYTLFFDSWMSQGFYSHGPYEVTEKFGENTTLIVREYTNFQPKEIWPELEMPYKKIKLLTIYKNLNAKINFVNHIITKDSIGDKLIAYKIYLDDKELKIEKIDELIHALHKVASTQTKKINSLTDLDKVRAGAKISFYMFKKLREFKGDNWIPENYVEQTISRFGSSLIDQFKKKKGEEHSVEHWKILFDPRNSYLSKADKLEGENK